MIWLTADTHFGHVNITKFRNRPDGQPFADVAEHDEFLIERWNERVEPSDEVWVLGDFVMGQKVETLPRIMDALNGRVLLIPGNHDGCWEGMKPSVAARWKQTYVAGHGIGVLPGQIRKVTLPSLNVDVDLCHFPYDRDERHGEQYAEHHPTDEGRFLFHGHVHDAWKVKGRQINVGVDVWDLAPVSMLEAELALVEASNTEGGDA